MLLRLEAIDIANQCSVCGAIATCHSLDALPCRYKGQRYERGPRPTGRDAGGSTRESLEVLQGFLWMGNAAACRRKGLDDLLVTHVLNCAHELVDEYADDDELEYERGSTLGETRSRGRS